MSSHPRLPFRWAVVAAEGLPWLDSGDPPEGFLSPRERSFLATLRFAPRRRKWLLGRLALKPLVESTLAEMRGRAVASTDITILNEPSGAPFVDVESVGRLDLPVSISHRASWGAAAVGDRSLRSLGIDLETLEPRSPDWFKDYFTSREIESALGETEEARSLSVCRTWSAKESALKALGVGLRVDTRSFEVGPFDPSALPIDGWRPIPLSASPAIDFGGFPQAFTRDGTGYVLTAIIVSDT